MRAAGPVVLALVLLALTGCGPTQTGAPDPVPSAGPTPTPTPTTTTAADDALRIVVRSAAGAASTWRLSCSPPGGSHPDPAKACQVLDENGASALPRVPAGRQCAQVYAGPETATITGTWQGRPVTSRLSRTNSCESGRWKALEGLLPKGG